MALATDLETRIDGTLRTLLDIAGAHAAVTFANALGAEDMVLTDLIGRHARGIGMFMLDTGRLPEETYRLLQSARERYDLDIQLYFPEREAIENYVAANGINAFYDSVALREQCCHLRKVEPLKRALRGKQAWITGMRREQAVTRKNLAASEFDATHGLMKYNPLVGWTQQDVWDYLAAHDVPTNELHARGFPSIGCAPCTRAVAPGEDIRAGRWWWELPEHKECGLHAAKPQPAASA